MGIRPDRKWILGGLAIGTILAGVGYVRARSGRDSSHAARILTERQVAAFLGRRRVDPDRLEAVRERVSEVLADEPDALLGPDGATTASLFLEATGDDPELVWYVEVPWTAVDAWNDPASTLEEAFPLESEVLRDASEAADATFLVHAVNPERPRWADETETDRGVVAWAPSVLPVDVDLVRMRLKPGLAEWLADRFAGFARQAIAGERTFDRLEAWSAEMIDLENMYTESIFLERGPGGYALYQYMEAAEMERVYDAYYDTWNPVARASERLLGSVLEEPETILEYPLESEFDLLAHAVATNRPLRVEECQRR